MPRNPSRSLRQLSFVVGGLCASMWMLFLAYRVAVLGIGGPVLIMWVGGTAGAWLLGWGAAQAAARLLDRSQDRSA